jgi:hypothetical protein
MISGKMMNVRSSIDLLKAAADSGNEESYSAIDFQEDKIYDICDKEHLSVLSILINICRHCCYVIPSKRPSNGGILRAILNNAYYLDKLRNECKQIKSIIILCVDISLDDFEFTLKPYQRQEIKDSIHTKLPYNYPCQKFLNEYKNIIISDTQSTLPIKITCDNDDIPINFSQTFSAIRHELIYSNSTIASSESCPNLNSIENLTFYEYIIDLMLQEMNKGYSVFINVENSLDNNNKNNNNNNDKDPFYVEKCIHFDPYAPLL